MCIRHTSAPAWATTVAIPASPLRAVTSLTNGAPRSSARLATAAFEVSMETGTAAPDSRSSSGTTLRSSSSSATGAAPGRVDSPPTSTRWAPSAAMRSNCATAASTSANSPPSEKESGVTFSTPIRAGRGRADRLPAAGGPAGDSDVAALGAVAAGLCRISGPRLRHRARLGRTLAAGLLDRAGRRRRLGLRRPEHLFGGLAGQERLELLALDGLVLEQQLGEAVELLAVGDQHLARGLVRLLDDAADLVVDLACDLVRVVRRGVELTAEERLRVVVAERPRPELLRHAEAHHHLLGRGRHLLEVVGRAGGDLAEGDLLGRPPAERHRERVRQLGARRQEL